MNFEEIKKESKIYPGEYLLHEPTMQIVICGAYNPDENFIRCLSSGRLLEDQVNNFKKIKLSNGERRERSHSKCKGCTGAR